MIRWTTDRLAYCGVEETFRAAGCSIRSQLGVRAAVWDTVAVVRTVGIGGKPALSVDVGQSGRVAGRCRSRGRAADQDYGTGGGAVRSWGVIDHLVHMRC